jgi:Domain of unknown function (DUF4112)
VGEEPETRALAQLRGLGRLLDGAVTIPGTRIRVGLDPLIGLVPVVGDWIGALFSAYIVARSVGLGVSGATVLRMLGNLALDLTIGAVPVLGDLFDLGFRANQRNLALLEAHLSRPDHRRRADLAVVLGVAGGLLVTVVGALAVIAWLLGVLLQAVAG